MSNYGCQQILISPDSKLKAVLEFVCQESNKLANCAIYYCRQLYFKTGQIAHRYDLNKLLKTNPHFKALYSHVGQATLTSSDSLPVFGAKPVREASRREGWKPSGKRLKRGLYRSSNGTKINADCNGSGNILRKVAATLGINLDGVSSGALITPLRVRLWTVQESPVDANQSASGLEA